MPATAPYFADIADGPDAGVAHWVQTDDGRRIRLCHWPASDARGSVLIFTGRTEYGEKYGAVARDLVAAGYCVVAIDWRGQGLSDRLIANPDLGHVADFADYQRDVRAVLDHITAESLPQPWFMIAHSMGGCIGLRALVGGMKMRAVAFSAPMWGIQMASATRSVAWGLTTLGTRMGFDEKVAPGQTNQSYLLQQPFAGNMLTNDAQSYAHLRTQVTTHQGLGLGGPTLRWLNAALVEMRNLTKAPSPTVPCIAFLGSNESIVDPAAIRTRMATWPNGVLHDMHGGKHEMLMDAPALRQPMIDKIIAHFDSHS